MEIDDATLQRIRQLLAPDFRRQQSVRVIEGGSSLPGNQADGTRVAYLARAVDTGALTDLRWELVYDAKSGYWYPNGGAPLADYVTGAFASSATSTWQDSLTPAFTFPLAGDYTADASAFLTQTVNAAVTPAMGLILSGVGPPGLYAEVMVPSVTAFQTLGHQIPAFSVVAGAVLSQAVFTQDATPAHSSWSQRCIRAWPLRVLG